MVAGHLHFHHSAPAAYGPGNCWHPRHGRVRSDLLYLIREGCVIAEHQRVDQISDGDLIRATASGLVHLQLMANPEYLAACAEDTYLSDVALAERIASRITSKGLEGQFSRATTAKNAAELVEYLKARANEKVGAPEVYLDGSDAKALDMLREAEAAVGATEIEVSKRLYVGNLPANATDEELRSAFVSAGLSIRAFVVPPRQSGKTAKWFGIVEMVDGKSAIAALESPALRIRGRRLLINESHTLSEQMIRRKGGRTPTIDITERLYVTGMSVAASEDTIRTLFQKHGLQPIDVFIPRDRHTRIGRGFGFVTMSSQTEAMQAIGALNGVLFDGRSLSVRPAEARRS
jgi:RNA recognition motif. (a.k.a. RRM, RBD, or RNP domain)